VAVAGWQLESPRNGGRGGAKKSEIARLSTDISDIIDIIGIVGIDINEFCAGDGGFWLWGGGVAGGGGWTMGVG
jgi:hypothetical protein